MANVPLDIRFIGISPSVDLEEKKSSTLNAETQPYTMADLAATIGTGAQGPQGIQGPAGPQGPVGPVGPAGLNWQGAWVSGTSYVEDDAVGYDGASWFCISATSGTTAPDVDTTHWALLASQGAQGPQGPAGAQGPTGPQGPQGASGSSDPKTVGSFGGGQFESPTLLNKDICVLILGASSGSYFVLPVANSSTPIGKEILVYSNSGGSTFVTSDTTQGQTIITSAFGIGSQVQLEFNQTMSFIYVGSGQWVTSAASRAPIYLSGKTLGDGVSNFQLVITNPTTTPLTKSQLNTLYPDSSNIKGLIVACRFITGGGLAYIKIDFSNWISVPITNVS